MELNNRLTLVLVILVCVCFEINNAEPSAKAIQKLRNDILKNYDKDARPTQNQTLQIQMSLFVHHVHDLNERTQVMKVEGVVFMVWNDNRLSWTPSDYEGVYSIYMADHTIWQPTVNLINGAGESGVDPDSDSVVLVRYTGEVMWSPPASFSAYCNTHLRNYPYDKHNCSLSFGSWTDFEDTLKLSVWPHVKNNPSNVTSARWEVMDIVQRAQSIEIFESYRYSVIHVDIILRRISSLHTFAHVFPAVFCILLNLSGFWLQPSDTSRYLVGVLSFVISSLLLLHLTATLPAGREIPIIATFFAKISSVTVAFLILTVIINAIAEMTRAPPNALVRIFRGGLGDFLCLHIFTPLEETTEKPASIKPDDEPDGETGGSSVASWNKDFGVDNRKDWKLLATAVDRIGFWMFTLVYIIVSAALMA